jgi:hypothetical protein
LKFLNRPKKKISFALRWQKEAGMLSANWQITSLLKDT